LSALELAAAGREVGLRRRAGARQLATAHGFSPKDGWSTHPGPARELEAIVHDATHAADHAVARAPLLVPVVRVGMPAPACVVPVGLEIEGIVLVGELDAQKAVDPVAELAQDVVGRLGGVTQARRSAQERRLQQATTSRTNLFGRRTEQQPSRRDDCPSDEDDVWPQRLGRPGSGELLADVCAE
jgi:hypothetical protein